MKSKIHKDLSVIKYITTKDKFKLIFLLLIVLAFYGSYILGLGETNYIDSILIPFQFPLFNVFMFTLLLMCTLNTCSTFDNSFSFYIIRLGNKQNYLKTLLKNVILITLIFFAIFFLLYFVGLNLFKWSEFIVHPYLKYDISNIAYSIFFLIRYVLISLCVVSICTLLYVNFKTRVSLIFNSIFCIGFLVIPSKGEIVTTLQLIPWSYFNIVYYGNFFMEVIYSILFITLIVGLIGFFCKINGQRKNWSIT